jgi:pSer/pThr/pTyr-binding forkhead associated (FHA) protein
LHPLASLPQTREPFIVFENIGGLQLASPWNCDSSNTFPDGLHVVRFKGQQSLKLGRGNECEMRISDVSISRLHAMLSLAEDGSVLLQDHKSKFGTLLDTGRLDKRLVIPNDSPLSVQSGRTLLSFSVLAVVGSDQDTVNDTDMIDDDAELVVDDDIYQNSLLLRPNTT